MRRSLCLLTILLVTPAFAYSQTQTPSAAHDRQNQTAQAKNESTVTGCLTGKTDQYQLVDQAGTTHLLFNPTVQLHDYVGQSVTLAGERDVQRDASASSDEGTAHGMGFFRVTQVTGKSGPCK
jgi:hypothetical protein